LDSALLRPGRLDRKIEIPEPNETQRLKILKIHVKIIAVRCDIDYESVVKLADGLNGADMRNVCTEAGCLNRSWMFEPKLDCLTYGLIRNMFWKKTL
jgi:ATP-dependent 26S proteasome regulatory subunit